jgi:hypothetical protein
MLKSFASLVFLQNILTQRALLLRKKCQVAIKIFFRNTGCLQTFLKEGKGNGIVLNEKALQHVQGSILITIYTMLNSQLYLILGSVHLPVAYTCPSKGLRHLESL